MKTAGVPSSKRKTTFSEVSLDINSLVKYKKDSQHIITIRLMSIARNRFKGKKAVGSQIKFKPNSPLSRNYNKEMSVRDINSEIAKLLIIQLL